MNWTKHVFTICLLVSLASYIPSIGAGFVFDFVGWQRAYEAGSFSDILTSFGYHGNHQFLHFVFYSFYSLFDLQPFPWYLLFGTLHAVNGYLLYRVIIDYSQQWKLLTPRWLALAGAILFLLNPYNVEVVVAKVCLHYLISLICIFSILILFLKYMQNKSHKALIVASVLYIISLFSLEISFITPLMITLAGLITWLVTENSRQIFRSAVVYSACLWALFGAYLVFNKLTLGTIVGHYGSGVHLNIDLLVMAETEIKYVVKHLFYARFYSFQTKQLLFDQILSLPEIAFFGICILIGLAIVYFIKIKKLTAKWHLAFFGLLGTILFTLPIANMYFTHLHIGMNDRYSYIPVAFIIVMLIALLSELPRWLKYGIVGLMLILNVFFQQETLRYWRISADVLNSLKEDFRWHDAPYVFILNSPDNYKGIVMTTNYEESGIDELIDNQTARPYNGVMYDVFQFNMTAPDDGVKVEQTGPMQLKVTFNQWGNWWHRYGIGASSYENEFYKVELLEYPYLLTFKKLPEGSVIIYQDGRKWKEFQFEE